tara:strand:+ start:251 stop:487 length:237 start_codon:yes stop_codon:yes gene_type:complete
MICSGRRRRSSRQFLKSGRTKGIYGDKPRKSSEQLTTVAVLFFLVGWAINKAKFNWQLEKKSQMAVFFFLNGAFNKSN